MLRYSLAAAREENITRASESLHISQPSLSKQLMELEDELGKKLFIRGKRKLSLTDDGLWLRRRAEELVELMDKTQNEMTAGEGGNKRRGQHWRSGGGDHTQRRGRAGKAPR